MVMILSRSFISCLSISAQRQALFSKLHTQFPYSRRLFRHNFHLRSVARQAPQTPIPHRPISSPPRPVHISKAFGLTPRASSLPCVRALGTRSKSIERGYASVATPIPHPRTAISPSLRDPTRTFATTAIHKMASDEDYMSFLDKANKDPSEGYAKTQTEKDDKGFRATQTGVEVPAAIARVTKDAFYVSDADEPFEAVALKLEGEGLPDEEEFARLINHPAPKDAEIEITDPVDWDQQGQYKEIIDAVREAGEGNDVRVYRVSRGGVKAEYWVVTATTDKKLVGVKALAVES